MSFISTLWKCSFGPRLFNIYEIKHDGRLIVKSYEANILERLSDKIVICFAAIWSISPYTIPLVTIFFYQHAYNYISGNVSSLGNLAANISTALVVSFAARGYSRATNPVYTKFLKTLDDANAHYTAETRQELNNYDFEFWAKPVDFNMINAEINVSRAKITLESIAASSGRIRRQTGKEFILTLHCKIISYIVAHTFAIKMIYPGSISFLNWALLHSTLLQGRIRMKLKYNGERYKLLTIDNNEIDAMFIDQRQRTTKGNTLVITCEGNFGFYETGIMATPLSKGYSILGWNHPGFGNSTGQPYPRQEENAVDCVMRFAIDHLEFSEHHIILYGWSIGGYTSTWAAMNYPSIDSLILDATFDDILPLAIMTMPLWMEGLVRNVIRNYFNLNIGEQLNRYNGTVLLIRRTQDEVICPPHDNSLSGNRANNLLTELLIRRYPYLFMETSDSFKLLREFLSLDVSVEWVYQYQAISKLKIIFNKMNVEKKRLIELIAADITKNDYVVKYPSDLGQDCDSVTKLQLILFLATMYMKNQQSTHCMPLEENLFEPGWNPKSTLSA